MFREIFKSLFRSHPNWNIVSSNLVARNTGGIGTLCHRARWQGTLPPPPAGPLRQQVMRRPCYLLWEEKREGTVYVRTTYTLTVHKQSDTVGGQDSYRTAYLFIVCPHILAFCLPGSVFLLACLLLPTPACLLLSAFCCLPAPAFLLLPVYSCLSTPA